MRRFTDPSGDAWDVVVGRESFGTMLALFVPAAGNRAGPRQTVLAAVSQVDAEAELDAARLDALFERSTPKETG